MRDASVEELSGFEIVVGDPDVRGWEVVGRDGRRVGEVKDLLVDTENPSTRYLEVRTDSPAGEEDVIGQAAVPGHGLHQVPARTVGEALVRDSLMDIENRMTAGHHPGEPFSRDEHHVLIPIDRAHLEAERHQVRVE
jgi:sporulation protein YlmC with PRC-barrel domain